MWCHDLNMVGSHTAESEYGRVTGLCVASDLQCPVWHSSQSIWHSTDDRRRPESGRLDQSGPVAAARMRTLGRRASEPFGAAFRSMTSPPHQTRGIRWHPDPVEAEWEW